MIMISILASDNPILPDNLLVVTIMTMHDSDSDVLVVVVVQPASEQLDLAILRFNIEPQWSLQLFS
jgi:hypothetical protein